MARVAAALRDAPDGLCPEIRTYGAFGDAAASGPKMNRWNGATAYQ